MKIQSIAATAALTVASFCAGNVVGAETRESRRSRVTSGRRRMHAGPPEPGGGISIYTEGWPAERGYVERADGGARVPAGQTTAAGRINTRMRNFST